MWSEPNPEDLVEIPKLYDNENIFWPEKIIGGCDWYAAEYDPEDRIYFGYAIFNRDFPSAEWGSSATKSLPSSVSRASRSTGISTGARAAGTIGDIVRGMKRSMNEFDRQPALFDTDPYSFDENCIRCSLSKISQEQNNGKEISKFKEAFSKEKWPEAS